MKTTIGWYPPAHKDTWLSMDMSGTNSEENEGAHIEAKVSQVTLLSQVFFLHPSILQDTVPSVGLPWHQPTGPPIYHSTWEYLNYPKQETGVCVSASIW